MKNLSIDIETFGIADLAKCGVYKYAEDFELLLFGYSADHGEVHVVDLARGESIPEEILNALTDDAVTKWAFNAQFERVCLSVWLRKQYPERLSDYGTKDDSTGGFLNSKGWRCSSVWAAYMGLPRSLADVGAVLGLSRQKLKEGKELIRYFCMPCRETKTNGGRTRNRPEDAPDKWALFKRYNKRDVEVEMAIQEKLQNFSVPDSVWDEYRLDQEINDRGIRLDMTLVRNALAFDETSKTAISEELKKLTGLENPNSVLQLKEWLARRGVSMESLGKKDVAFAMKTAEESIKSVLMLRSRLAKSSVKKYRAMETAVCRDSRARGMFQFYGASRSGRFSGRIIQLQNLPQNHIADLAEAGSLVRQGNYEAAEMLYEDVPEMLSQLIRTAFVPKEGMKFIVSDFSAIEARVIAWLAGETWKQEAFAGGEDIYCSTASRMFGVPVVKHGVNGELRQKGKIAELACIAEGELVLTDKGPVPIEKVTKRHLLWDGQNWVHHDGVIYKGKGEVIEHEGLRATADHFVWIEGETQPVQFGLAAACGAHLVQTGDGRRAIRPGENYQPGKAMECETESLLCTDTMHELRKHSVAGSECSYKREIKRLPAMLTGEEDSEMAGQASYGGKTEMRKSAQFGIQKLRCTRNKIFISKCNRGWALFDGKIRWECFPKSSVRQNRQQRRLCSGKYKIGDKGSEYCQSKNYGSQRISSKVLALCEKRGYTQIVSGNDEGRNYSGGSPCSNDEKEKQENHRGKVRLYDIRNAGEHHRFTVSNHLVHNCGYGGSAGALKAMGALEMGIPEEELPGIVENWRKANSRIVKLWWDIDKAVKDTVRNKSEAAAHGIFFEYRSGMLFITLPSGRKLTYIRPRIGENRFGGEAVTYEGTGISKKWERIESYGPKFTENIVQAIARDILCYAMQSLSSYFIVGHVHDEVIIECEKDVRLRYICELMGKTPPWAEGLVLRADGYECEFYKKD